MRNIYKQASGMITVNMTYVMEERDLVVETGPDADVHQLVDRLAAGDGEGARLDDPMINNPFIRSFLRVPDSKKCLTNFEVRHAR